MRDCCGPENECEWHQGFREAEQIQELRIQQLHQNAASCMKENARLKAANAGLEGSLAAAIRKPASGQKVGDLKQFWQAVKAESVLLDSYAELYSPHKRIQEHLYELRDILDGYAYLVEEDQ